MRAGRATAASSSSSSAGATLSGVISADTPHWPCALSPHVTTCPSSSTAAECIRPADTETARAPGAGQRTRYGRHAACGSRAAANGLPSCPSELSPSEKTAPEVVRQTRCTSPADSSTMGSPAGRPSVCVVPPSSPPISTSCGATADTSTRGPLSRNGSPGSLGWHTPHESGQRDNMKRALSSQCPTLDQKSSGCGCTGAGAPSVVAGPSAAPLTTWSAAPPPGTEAVAWALASPSSATVPAHAKAARHSVASRRGGMPARSARAQYRRGREEMPMQRNLAMPSAFVAVVTLGLVAPAAALRVAAGRPALCTRTVSTVSTIRMADQNFDFGEPSAAVPSSTTEVRVADCGRSVVAGHGSRRSARTRHCRR
eukprot:scaffold31634_cov93-Isochrysis_galbana.AAC.1